MELTELTHNIKPCFWGSKFWGTIFSMCATYPDEPSQSFIKSIKMYLISLRDLLPCGSCRVSYRIFSSEEDTNVNNDYWFTDRNKFITMIHCLREKVNNKIGLEYKINLKYFTRKLDKMCCSDYNSLDSTMNTLVEAPFIQDELIEHVLKYVQKNSHLIINYNQMYTKILMKRLLTFVKDPKFITKNKDFKLWIKRNNQCRIIINKIYNNMACKDYPMYESFFKDKIAHLHLFYMGCSIIPVNDLKHCFNI